MRIALMIRRVDCSLSVIFYYCIAQTGLVRSNSLLNQRGLEVRLVLVTRADLTAGTPSTLLVEAKSHLPHHPSQHAACFRGAHGDTPVFYPKSTRLRTRTCVARLSGRFRMRSLASPMARHLCKRRRTNHTAQVCSGADPFAWIALLDLILVVSAAP